MKELYISLIVIIHGVHALSLSRCKQRLGVTRDGVRCFGYVKSCVNVSHTYRKQAFGRAPFVVRCSDVDDGDIDAIGVCEQSLYNSNLTRSSACRRNITASSCDIWHNGTSLTYSMPNDNGYQLHTNSIVTQKFQSFFNILERPINRSSQTSVTQIGIHVSG